MKGFFYGILLFWGVAVFGAASGIVEEAQKGNEKADMSYAFGMLVGSDLISTGLEFNYDAFIQGFRNVMENEDTRYTMNEAMEKIEAAYDSAQALLRERNLAEGIAFLEANSQNPGVIVTPSGLQYEVITEGTGGAPGPADMVWVHYQGFTIDGTVFDTTYNDEMPWEIPLDNVIPGWSEGLRMMREGGKSRLYIPPNLAYGERGAGMVIAPNAVLIFDVELIAIVKN